MTGCLRRLSSRVFTAVVLGIALPGSASALQLGATMDLHSGPIAWDQPDGRDPLLSGELKASYQLPHMFGLRPELLGEFGFSTGPAEPPVVGWDIGARLHTAGTRTGAWLGVAAGAAGAGSFKRALTRVEGGFRRAVGPARINVWLSRTGFGTGIAPDGLSQDSVGLPDTLGRKGVTEYTDLSSRVTFSLRRYEVGLSLTRRLGSATNRRNGWELSGTWWVAPSVGVVGSAGHSLPQLGFALPGGRYGTLGLRLALGARSPTEQTRRVIPAVESSTGPTLVVAARRITIRGAAAASAEVMGDFTDWRAIPLSPLGAGRWTLPVALTPGVHHLNVRFDGGDWLVPAGAVAVDDGFGGRVGLVVVR